MEVCYNCFGAKSGPGPCPHCGYDPAGTEEQFPMALHPDSILNGRYVVGRVLGQGGFGITYIALDDHTQKRVAIKEYLPTEFVGRIAGSAMVQPYSGSHWENFEYGKAQFLQEAKTLAEFIGDEHIVRIYSYFEENGTAYFAMEYVEGLPLDKYMATKGGRLTVEEADDLLLPLMEALELVHSKGIVHRDIAPDNIIVTPSGKAKLIDFGAARYSTGEKSKSLDVVIKHGFAPKEQYTRRGRQGPFTDVYAMAATYYYAITGRVPPESIDRMEEDELIPPENLGVRISKDVEVAIYKGLAVSANYRYQTMGAFREAMTSTAEQEKQERERLEWERRERERLEQERLERERLEREAAEKAREEQERLEREAAEKAREEQERLEREAAEKARREQERLEREAAEKARREQERREKEAAEKARREQERLEREAEKKARREQERLDKEAAKKAREEQKQLAREAAEKAAEEKRQSQQQTSGGKPASRRLPLIAAVLVLVVAAAFFAGRELFQSTPAVSTTEPSAPVTTEAPAEEIPPEETPDEEDQEVISEAPAEEEPAEPAETPAEEAPAEPTEVPAEEEPAEAAETPEWTLENGVLTVFGSGPMADYASEEAPWYDQRENITSVVVSPGVTSISAGAFSDCSALTSVTIPEGVTEIGENAFSNCAALMSVSLPASIERIDEFAFFECDNLTSLSYEGEGWDGVSVGTGNDSLLNLLVDDTPEAVEISWSMKRNVMTLSGDGPMADFPSAKDAPWYANRGSVTSIVIQDGVTKIGANAFAGFTSLTSVKIPESVTGIDPSAFSGCNALSSFEVDGNNTAFCSDSYGVLYNGAGTQIFLIPQNLSAVYSIKEGVTSINARAFYGCTKLKNLKIPESVTSIGEGAFAGCTSLSNIKLPSALTFIGDNAFSDCDKLTTLTIPDKVTAIYDRTFFSCDKLVTINLPDGVVEIGNSAFAGCECLKNINIPSSLAHIGDSAFRDCNMLAIIKLPNGVTEIPDGAFCDCENLGIFTFPGALTRIGSEAFKGTKLKSVEFPDSLISIGTEAFYNCDFLTSISMCEGVETIGSKAFYSCDKLLSVTIPASVTKIGSSAFFLCGELRYFRVAEGNTAYCNDSYGSLLTGNGETLIQVPMRLNGDYIVSDGVKTIGSNAFYGCQRIKKIVFPAGTERIEENAFYRCDYLQEVSIPASLTSISLSAFSYCECFRAFRVEEGNTAYHSNSNGDLLSADGTTLYRVPQSKSGDYSVQKGVTVIGNGAFVNCTRISTVTLPDGVVSIGADAFDSCISLRRIYVPATLQRVGDGAFSYCPKFRYVNYSGTKESWKDVQIGSMNYYLNRASIVCR